VAQGVGPEFKAQYRRKKKNLTVRYYCTPIKMATTKNNNKKNPKKCGNDLEKLEPLSTVGENVKQCSHVPIVWFLKKT
jgi:hypothetical protein